MQLNINTNFKSLIPALTEQEFAGLKKSILTEGCRDAIVLWNNIIIDGHNRYEICIENDIDFKTIQIEFDNENDAKLWICENQRNRRNLNDWQRFENEQKIKDILLEKGRNNLKTNIGNNQRLSIIDKGKHNTRNEIAQNLGWSTGKVAMAEIVNKKANSEQRTKLQNNDIGINKVYIEIRKEERKQKAEQIKNIELPNNKYQVIYSDPPWSYNDKQNTIMLGGAEKHYSTMLIQELCELDIQKLCLDNCVLFLWVTSPFLEDSFKIIKAWGFSYKTSFVWDKIKHNMGHYNSVRHEFLLIATKGSCTPDNLKLFDSVQSIEKSNIHSEKPEEFYDIIETLYKGKKIELFARKKRKGFDSWGNEINE